MITCFVYVRIRVLYVSYILGGDYTCFKMSVERDLERSTYLEQKRDSRLQLFTITKISDINRMFLKTILLNTIGTTTIYIVFLL